MARLFTLGTLRLRSQRRSDKEGDPQITDPEWNSLIAEMYAELEAEADAVGARLREAEQTIAATGAATYALPSDFLAIIAVDWVWDSAGHRKRLRRLNVQQRSRWIGAVGDARRWELAGPSIALYPTPKTGTYKLLYIPQPVDLTSALDSTQVDVVCPDGEAFLIWGVACKALSKGEASEALANAKDEREAARGRFVSWCAARSFNDGPTPFVDAGDAEWDERWGVASLRWNPP